MTRDKISPILAGTLLISVAAASLTLPALADPSTSKEIKYKSRDLEKIQQELNRKKEENQRLKKEAEDLSNAVKQQEVQIKNIEQALSYTRRKNSEISQDLAVTKNRHDQVVSKIDADRQAYTDSMKRYYVASLLNGPNGIAPVVSRQLIHQQAGQLRELRGKKESVQRELDTLIDTQKAIRGEVDRQEGKLSDVRSGYETKERLLSKKMTRQETVEMEMRELAKTAQELASLIDVLRTKSKEEAAVEKQARLQKQLSGQSPILPHSLSWPIKGKVVTRFGRQENSKSGATYISNGIIIGTLEDSQVSAVADGKVLYAGQFMSYGAMTVVEHPGDWYTVYGHLAKWDVEKGQEVKKGDRIGQARPRTAGGTEAYFELRFYGKPTDPMPWLSQ